MMLCVVYVRSCVRPDMTFVVDWALSNNYLRSCVLFMYINWCWHCSYKLLLLCCCSDCGE